MGFADDLLEQADHLANREADVPKQASLRRAVSTAYYALFHLLIEEAVSKWAVERQRSAMGRTFKHGSMLKVCQGQVKAFSNEGKPESGLLLKNVAQAFVNLQQSRHTADYDTSFDWSRSDTIAAVALASTAFEQWREIRDDGAAQDFLLQLFLPEITALMKPSKA